MPKRGGRRRNVVRKPPKPSEDEAPSEDDGLVEVGNSEVDVGNSGVDVEVTGVVDVQVEVDGLVEVEVGNSEVDVGNSRVFDVQVEVVGTQNRTRNGDGVEMGQDDGFHDVLDMDALDMDAADGGTQKENEDEVEREQDGLHDVHVEVIDAETTNVEGQARADESDFIDTYDWSFLDAVGVNTFEDNVENVEINVKSNVQGSVKGKVVSDGDNVVDEDDGYDDDYVGDEDDFEELTESEDDSTTPWAKFNEEVVFNPDFKLGMIFETKKLFKKVVTSHAIDTRRSLHFPKNDKKRIVARCKDSKCDWVCHALKVTDKETFQIRKYNPSHTCFSSYHVANLKSSWLAEKYLGDFQNDPNRNVKGWRTEVTKRLNVNISRQQAYRAKKKAVSIIEGVPDQQYSMLWDYAAEIRRSNPGSTCVLDISEEGRFSKFYVCYAAVKEGFRKGCRSFIGVDGCHLKGPRGGVLLTSVEVDPSDAIFPLAVAVVDIENKSNWDWFLINLKHDLGIQDHGNFTIMSDKQKGLLIALKEVFPNAEHRNCVRHLHVNMQSAGFRGLAFKNAMWRAARATTPGMFKQRMLELKILNEAAFKWFENKDPSHWSMAYFNTASRCDMLLNNVCESFNAAIIDVREKPIITMFEWIRHWLMQRFQSNRDRATDTGVWSGRLPPKIRAKVKQIMAKTNDCIPVKASNKHYQILFFDGSSFSIDLELWKCSCRGWELSGIPCVHAMSVIIHSRCDPEMFVDLCYSMERYKLVYEPVILPLAGKVDWGCTMFNPPMPPIFKRPLGRPKKLRRKNPFEKDDFQLKRQKTVPKCRKCGLTGHNKKTCKQEGSSSNAPLQPTANSTAPPPPLQPTTNSTAPPQYTASSSGPTKSKPSTLGSKKKPSTVGSKKKSSAARGGSKNTQLYDEDDADFEALLSQANDAGLIHGHATQESLTRPGPTPWEQLSMSAGVPGSQ